MDSRDWANYIEATDSLSKPWLLLQWRLQLLQERRAELSAEEYSKELAALQQELMGLGKWWVGQEDQVFGADEPDKETGLY
jgi:hypothetical protein